MHVLGRFESSACEADTSACLLTAAQKYITNHIEKLMNKEQKILQVSMAMDFLIKNL